MTEVNIENIPAFQRKRSISAKARELEKSKYKFSTSKPRKKPSRKTTKKRMKEEEPTIGMLIDDFPEPEVMESLSTPSKRAAGIKEMKLCGICDGYFEKIDVAVIQLTSPLREGDKIIMETNNGLFQQTVTSMQIDRKPVKIARSGSDIGIKVLLNPKVGGSVYKII